MDPRSDDNGVALTWMYGRISCKPAHLQLPVPHNMGRGKSPRAVRRDHAAMFVQVLPSSAAVPAPPAGGETGDTRRLARLPVGRCAVVCPWIVPPSSSFRLRSPPRPRRISHVRLGLWAAVVVIK